MSLKDFQIVSKLGQGAYSSVYLVKRLVDNTQYAMKKVKMNNLSDKQRDNALNQVRILASIIHPNIIGYKQAFIDKTTNFLYIIMEYADDGDLFSQIQDHLKYGTKFSQQQIWSIFIQMTRGLKTLHQLKILHRDMKSANVFLFKNGYVKLGDLNVSKLFKGMCQTQTGTPYYASPQVWKDQSYDKKSDMWSLGCVLYEAIALKPPFRANDMQGLHKKVIRGFYPGIPNEYSNELTIILKMLLQVTPHMRSSCDRLLQLPLIQKHVIDLPALLLESQNNLYSASLLQTIKIDNKLSKAEGIKLPKPRYSNTIDASQLNKKRKVSSIVKNQEGDIDWLKQSRSKYSVSVISKQSDKKQHKIGKHNQNAIHLNSIEFQYNDFLKRQSQMGKINFQVSKPIINLDSPKNIKNYDYHLDAIKNKKLFMLQKQRKKSLDFSMVQQQNSRKLPKIYQGRLRQISKSALKKILQRQQQKRRIVSIINKH